MSRRTWFVLLFVVAVLVIAPHLPQWWPAAVDAVRNIDVAAISHRVVAESAHGFSLVQDGVAVLLQHPQVVGGVAAGLAVTLFASMLVRSARHRRESRIVYAAPAVTVMPTELPAVVAAPMRAADHLPARIAAPVEPIPEPEPRTLPRPATAGRGTAVRRMSAAGHSTAEISRATRVGQDAVRLVLSRQGAA